jgi:ABC-type amino acid transport substrate-binding protein
MPYYIYVRESDHRFDNQFDKINDPSVKVAYLEGEMGQKVKEQDFPNATSLSLQNMTGFGEVSLQVATGKADIAMGEPAVMDGFIEKNPGKIRQVSGPPVRMQGAAMQVGVYEHELQGMLDGTLAFLRDNGFVARTFDKYLGKPGHYYFLPSEPWEEVPAK